LLWPTVTPGSITTKEDADDAILAGATIRDEVRKFFDLTEVRTDQS
jgi:hypothetical protein